MFYFKEKKLDIRLEEELLTIVDEYNQLIVSVEYRHVLKVNIDDTSLSIHYVIKKSNKTLQMKTLQIHNGSKEELTILCDEIQTKFTGRPKRILVFINPKSGKNKGIKIYQKFAAPLFQLCDIKADVIVTTKPKEPAGILCKYDLIQIDGIVVVGGDGTYCECMNGLVSRVQMDNHIDFHSHRSDIKRTSLPIGIIPAGSGDVIVQYLHGTRCARTAVLHILLGNQVNSNIVSVHEGGKLLSYSALILGFGLFGDMMNQCEKFRWMGSSRFSVIPLGCMLKRRLLNVEVEYYPSKPTNKCQKRTGVFGRQISLPIFILSATALPQKRRTKSATDLQSCEQETEDCQKEKGRAYGIDSRAITIKEQNGKMAPQFGHESLVVFTTHQCTLLDHIAQLTKVKNEKPDCYDYKFVNKHEVSAYRVRLLNTPQKDYYINCDGEVIRLTEPMFDVKLHTKAVRFYGDISQ